MMSIFCTVKDVKSFLWFSLNKKESAIKKRKNTTIIYIIFFGENDLYSY